MRTTYCRGQDCRWPVTNNFPTLAAVELRVLVDSKSGAPSLVSVGAAVGDPQRLSALIFIVPLLATVEALHVGLLLLVRRRLCLAFAFTLALASFAARLAARPPMKSATPQVRLDANASKAPIRAGLPYPFVATVPLNILCRGPQLRFARRDKEEIAASIPIRTSAKITATTKITPIKASTLGSPLVATSRNEYG